MVATHRNVAAITFIFVCFNVARGVRVEESYNGMDGPKEKLCKPWCGGDEIQSNESYSAFCGKTHCDVRTLIHDDTNVLHPPTYMQSQGRDYGWQQILLIRNGVCPNLADKKKCFVSPPSGFDERTSRCGACRMSKKRGDLYFISMRKPKNAGEWNTVRDIKTRYGGTPQNMIMYGITAISLGYEVNGKKRKFHKKAHSWLEFKRFCGFHCKSAVGLKFLPNTYNLKSKQDLQLFTDKHFNPNTMYLAKGEIDAKGSIKFVQAKTANKLLKKIHSDGKDWTVVQEMISNPALAKYGSNPGFKVNMRTFLVLTCTKEKRKWVMLRAGSHLHYAMQPYPKDVNPANMMDFNAAIDTSYNSQDLVSRGYMRWEDANRWPSSNIAFLKNLKMQGWTDSVEKEWNKIEGIFKTAAAVYDDIVCNENDMKVLEDVGKQVYLVGADILMTGNVEPDGRKSLQPYLIEWNTGPAFGDSGHPDDFEHKQITEIAVLKQAGILPPGSWTPLFLQREYKNISPDSFDKEGVVWKTIDEKVFD